MTSRSLPTFSSNSCQNFKLLSMSTPVLRMLGLTVQEPTWIGVKIED